MNNRQQIIEFVSAIARELSERSVENIDLDTHLADLGMDSLAMTEMAIQIEEAFGLSKPLVEWFQARTVRDIITLIEESQQ